LSGAQGAASLDGFAGTGSGRTRDERVLLLTVRIE
jgi:hypothetical protein